jgi:trehalose-6-phosphate synthase
MNSPPVLLSSMWNQDALREIINKRFSDHQLVVVSNRQPYAHQYHEGRVVLQRAVSGVVTGLEPVVKACSGIWVAHGDGSAASSKFLVSSRSIG